MAGGGRGRRRCLQYAILNAYRALCYPLLETADFIDSERETWQRLISITPSLHNFSSGTGSHFGEFRYSKKISRLDDDGDIRLKESFMALASVTLSESSKNSLTLTRSNFSKIRADTVEQSAVILNIRGNALTRRGLVGDHWLVIVDYDEDNYYLACSYSDYLPPLDEGFSVGLSPRLKRPFNNVMEIKKLTRSVIWSETFYRMEFRKIAAR